MGIESPIIKLHEDDEMKFHDHLKQLREARGITQAQVAESVDIAKNTYIGYEKGSREPRLSELKKLAKLFQVELGELCLEPESEGLSGWLKAAMKRADSLRAREKAALMEVMHGYITSCQVAQISGKDQQWIQELENAQVDELVKEESMIEELSK